MSIFLTLDYVITNLLSYLYMLLEMLPAFYFSYILLISPNTGIFYYLYAVLHLTFILFWIMQVNLHRCQLYVSRKKNHDVFPTEFSGRVDFTIKINRL